MRREEIIEACRIGRERAQQAGFAQTPLAERHKEAFERLLGHRGVLDSLSHEQLRAFAQWDEPAVLCGRVEDFK